MSQSRRLAAILAADVVGYSRLMGADEEGTLERLKALRSELIDPNIAKHHGRIVKTTGDGMLVEFASVVDAVRCAAEVQRAMSEWNAGVAVDRRIELRIGINLGDVIADGDDLYGDGVNIAARIEALADAGGVFVSGTAYDHVRDRLPFGFEDRGEQQVKNITRPIRVYRVSLEEAVSTAPRKAQGSLSEKPSIAVLPFQNMSGDPEQEYFSDGVSSDIITELSRNHSIIIISRNSSFTYRGRSIDVRRVSRELGVRYVVEGSVRRSGDKIRVSVQLIEGEAGNHLWAERYDRLLQDVFTVQDEIAAAVITAVLPVVMEVEQRRALRKPPENVGAWEAYQRGLWHLGKCSVQDNAQAQLFLERAIALDTEFAAARAALARVFSYQAAVSGSLAFDRGLSLARKHARAAVDLDPDDPEGRAVLAWMQAAAGQGEAALEGLSSALVKNPNSAWAIGIRGAILVTLGNRTEGRAALLTAVRLNPRDPTGGLFPGWITISYYLDRDYTRAVTEAHSVIERYPDYSVIYRWLAAALGQLGRKEEATEILTRAIEASPSSFELHTSSRPAWFRHDDREHMLDGLRKAGWQGSAK
jgi:adenylate cyclase